MLVLSRLRNQSVILTWTVPPDAKPGDEIRARVTVSEIQGDRVRLAFDAPWAVEVHRSEIQAVVDRERGRA